MGFAEISNFGGIWNFSQKGGSWRYWSLSGDNEIEQLGFLQNFTICHFGLSPFLAKLLTEKVLLAIIHCSNAKTAINYHVEYERAQTT